MAGEVRYCTTEDGVSIAYSVEGEGSPLVVFPSLIEAFSLLHYDPAEEAFWRRIAEHHQLVWFDWRGTGLSQREVPDPSLESVCRDVDAVVAALNLRKFALWAGGTSNPTALTYAGTRPSRVSRLIAYCPNVRPTDSLSSEAILAFAALWRTNPQVASQALADLSGRQQYPVVGEQVARRYSESISGETAARLFEASARPDWDAGPYLRSITAPTLVLRRRNVALFPASAAQEIASNVKNARLLQIDGDVQHIGLGDSEAVQNAMLAFLAEGERKPRAKKAAPTAEATPGGLKTVLFTDIVGHTEMMQRLGDAKGRDVLREHERITRETLKAHGGAEVKTMGDGFMASFGSVTSAMECAIALQRAFAAHTESMPEPLHVRVGLNAGEPIEEDGDLFGATVILASRIAAKAGAGEILVPDTVRGLLSGKQFVFSDRGEFVPKGFDDAVRLYEVRWREMSDASRRSATARPSDGVQHRLLRRWRGAAGLVCPALIDVHPSSAASWQAERLLASARRRADRSDPVRPSRRRTVAIATLPTSRSTRDARHRARRRRPRTATGSRSRRVAIGAALAIAYAAQHPDRVSHLILCDRVRERGLTTAQRCAAMDAHALAASQATGHASPRRFAARCRLGFAGASAVRPALRDVDASRRDGARCRTLRSTLDVRRTILRGVSAPTLMLARSSGRRVASAEASQRSLRRIPNARSSPLEWRRRRLVDDSKALLAAH